MTTASAGLAELIGRLQRRASALIQEAIAPPAVRRLREDDARVTEVLVLRTTALEEVELAVSHLRDHSIVSDLEREWVFGCAETMPLRLYSLWVSEADHPRAVAALH